MGKFTALLVTAAIALGASNACADEWSPARSLDQIEIESAPAGQTGRYYLRHIGGWGFPECPAAEWVYIATDRVGAREMLAVAMQAQQQGKLVQVYTACNGGYMPISHITAPPQ